MRAHGCARVRTRVCTCERQREREGERGGGREGGRERLYLRRGGVREEVPADGALELVLELELQELALAPGPLRLGHGHGDPPPLDPGASLLSSALPTALAAASSASAALGERELRWASAERSRANLVQISFGRGFAARS